ncbi:hypothetical protein [Psychrobacter sp. FDAARGOS_221]|uniref:hypothetical protein n=1 Tax=Psychrobacter sp. FDAARGOS_221 TaxID=1975705 RepID=UPI000BB57EBE|nr:hypothetical protein [Psychrobacter sp. FDAARGOS_221]PNK59937.1 hypothetical protein A6J60_002935 [Psychrobacter sp. FDAARGOS_221]
MKHIEIKVKDDRDKPWIEEYQIDNNQDEYKWATRTIKSFNESLRPDERPRTLLDVKVVMVTHDDEDDDLKDDENDENWEW